MHAGGTFLLTIGIISLILSICLCCIFYCAQGSSEQEITRREPTTNDDPPNYRKLTITSMEHGPSYPGNTPPYPVGNPTGMPQPVTSPVEINVTDILLAHTSGASNPPGNISRPSETFDEDGPPPSYADVMKIQ